MGQVEPEMSTEYLVNMFNKHVRALEENLGISGLGLCMAADRAQDKDWEGAPETPMLRTTQGRGAGAGPKEELRARWKSHGGGCLKVVGGTAIFISEKSLES